MTTNQDQDLHDVTAALKSTAAAVQPVEASAAIRARQLAALTEAMSAPPVLAQRPVRLLALAAAALVGVVAATLYFASRPTPPIAVAPPPPSPTPVVTAEPPRELENPGDAPRTFAVAEGVRVELAPGARATRTSPTSLLVLRGEVAAEVALGQEFRLDALDTSVSVRGGQARVTPGAGCDGRARVEALAGQVLVNGEPLAAAQTWPKCEAAVAPLKPRTPTPRSPVVVTPRQQEVSSLERENALYRDALALQRRGDVRKAVSLLDEVLAHRESPLAEAALAHKMKWLSALDPDAARKAATEYLARFPRGFGRADAETLVLGK